MSKGILILLLMAISLIACGCANHTIGVAPPCASIKAPSVSDNRKVYGGQGLLVGNKLLTAGHTFVQEGSPFPPNEIFVNGRVSWVKTHGNGDIETVKRLYGKEGSLNPADFLEDWVALEVERFASRSVPEWSIGDGKVELGQALYAVRVDVIDHRLKLDSALLIVAKPVTDEQLSERLIFVTNPTHTNLNSWSGCFVGTYDEHSEQWILTGILICGKEKGGSPEYHIVLRPPAETLQWLIGR